MIEQTPAGGSRQLARNRPSYDERQRRGEPPERDERMHQPIGETRQQQREAEQREDQQRGVASVDVRVHGPGAADRAQRRRTAT